MQKSLRPQKNKMTNVLMTVWNNLQNDWFIVPNFSKAYSLHGSNLSEQNQSMLEESQLVFLVMAYDIIMWHHQGLIHDIKDGLQVWLL